MDRLSDVLLDMERQRADAARPAEVRRALKEVRHAYVALTKVRNDDADLGAEAHEKRVATELNAQFEELRDQSQALIAAVKGRRGIQSAERWQAVFQKAKIDYENGRFLLEQLGAERFLEPELMATLAQLRRELLAGIENPTGADTMMADSAIIAYRNMLRVQAWIGSLCLTVERELFGQAPLNELLRSHSR